MLIILLTLFAFPPAVFAYLDLTTGSYFFQIALGTMLGLLVSFRARIKQAFWAFKNKPAKPSTKETRENDHDN